MSDTVLLLCLGNVLKNTTKLYSKVRCIIRCKFVKTDYYRYVDGINDCMSTYTVFDFLQSSFQIAALLVQTSPVSTT